MRAYTGRRSMQLQGSMATCLMTCRGSGVAMPSGSPILQPQPPAHSCWDAVAGCVKGQLDLICSHYREQACTVELQGHAVSPHCKLEFVYAVWMPAGWARA